MSIVSINMLSARIPGSPSGADLLKAVNRATGFVNTWTSMNYDPWQDFQASPELTLAPVEIAEECLEIAETMYYIEIGEIQRDGEGRNLHQEFLKDKRESLQTINVMPTWESQTISLDSNNRMVIGTRDSVTGVWPRVIPFNAEVVSSSSSTWIRGEDWYIRRGGVNQNEFGNAWYFDAQSSSVAGTLHYLRTYRKDTKDYMNYSKA